MPDTVCPECGAEIPRGLSSCEACATTRPRTRSPAVWQPGPARRRALLAGIVLALLILGALVWRIADSRRSTLSPSAPILPVGGADEGGR